MKQTFVRWKIFIQRSLSYMSIFSAGSLFFLVADRLKDYGLNYSVVYLAPLIFFLSLVFCIFLGWFDLKSGVYAEELKIGSVNNPVLMEILDRVKKLEDKKR